MQATIKKNLIAFELLCQDMDTTRPKIGSFRDLRVWQKARDLAVRIYSTTEMFPRSELYGITNQMRRAAISISSNIAEGFKRPHEKEKRQFYSIAQGSLAELESQIEVSYQLNFLTKLDYENLLLIADDTSKMLNGLIRSLGVLPRNPQSAIRNPSSSGFTLVELLVAIAIFSILVAVGVGGFVRALRTQREVAALIAAQSNASVGIEEMTREIRTGYLFCDVAGNDQQSDPQVNSACQWDGVTGCTVDTALDTWTCNNILDFVNAQGQEVDYKLDPSTGALGRSDNGPDGPYEPITTNDVHTSYLTFTIFGNTEGDHWPPRITIALGVSPSSTDAGIENDVLNLQTTVSARQIDCTPTAPLKC